MKYSDYIKQLETAMPVTSLGKAKLLAEQRWIPLEDHLIKLAIWGDRVGWRKEVYAFCKNLQRIELKLANRTFLTKMEYLEASVDFRKVSQEAKAYFKIRVKNISKKMKIKAIREEETARYIVHRLQIELSELLSQGLGEDNDEINKILDRYLK